MSEPWGWMEVALLFAVTGVVMAALGDWALSHKISALEHRIIELEKKQ